MGEGLPALVQGSVEAVQGRFYTFPIKICLLIASLRSDWSNTTERFPYSTVFAVVSGNATVAASFPMRSRIALLCNTRATRRRLERRFDSHREEGEAEEASAKARRFTSYGIAASFTSFEHLWTKMCLVIWCGINHCIELMQWLNWRVIVGAGDDASGARSFTVFRDSVCPSREHFPSKRSNGLHVRRCAGFYKRIHIDQWQPLEIETKNKAGTVVQKIRSSIHVEAFFCTTTRRRQWQVTT